MSLKNLVKYNIQMNCWKMPIKGSRYCTEHKHVKEEQKKVAAGL